MTFKSKIVISNLVMCILPAALSAILVYVAYAQLGGFSSLTEKVRSLGLLIALLIVMLLLVVSVSMTFAVMRNLTSSINRLNQAVALIRDGDLDECAKYPYNDEFSGVFDTLEVMRERLAESLRERERVERRKAEMIANISHDLKTPITSIRGYAQGLLDGVADTPEKTERYLRTICEKADDLNRLAEDLLMLSGRDAGMPLHGVEPTEMSGYLEDTLGEFEGLNIEKQLISGYALLDADTFKRVIRNIIENSVKYCQEGCCAIRAQLRRQDDRLIISLADNGPGVSEEKRIFERFYRGDGARTNPGKGSGLGLSIARQIVEAHGGMIWARTPPGGGLCVYISLPEFKLEEQREKNTDN